MEKFMQKPDTTLYPGIVVTKDTDFEYQNEFVKQTIKKLELHSVEVRKAEGWESTLDSRIQLQEGDVLIFEEEMRGYIKPIAEFMTVKEAIAELKNMEG